MTNAPLLPPHPHNERLLDAVHPPTWQNPRAANRYHLVVIGAGTAGLVSAAGAAGLGAKVALIERHLMGGDCLNVGCVPSKSLLAAARHWHHARHAAAHFAGPTVNDNGNFADVMDRLRRLRADIAPVDGAARFRDLGVDVFFGDASFTGADTVEVAGQTLRFRRAVIATGARAALPDIPGLPDVPFYTNETIFNITTCPPRLLVLGGGPIGCEMAQAFARLGSNVTLLQRDTRLLPREDADAAQLVTDALRAEGVTVHTACAVQRASARGSTTVLDCVVDGRALQVEGDTLLVAAGRTPNVEGLGLERANVRYTPRGVTVNDALRTSNPRIFAAGDVCSTQQFTHAADFQARTVIQNALFFGRKRNSRLIVPRATYTAPEVAQVGHTVESARAAGVAIQSFTVPMHDVDRAIVDGETRGFVRIHLHAGSARIAGATIVGEHAGELLAEVTLCMTHGLGLDAIGASMHPYPTQSDAVRKCADAWRRTKLTPTVRSLFATWFRWFS